MLLDDLKVGECLRGKSVLRLPGKKLHCRGNDVCLDVSGTVSNNVYTL